MRDDPMLDVEAVAIRDRFGAPPLQRIAIVRMDPLEHLLEGKMLLRVFEIDEGPQSARRRHQARSEIDLPAAQARVLLNLVEPDLLESKQKIDASVKYFESENSFKRDAPFDHVFGTPCAEIEEQRAIFNAGINRATNNV